MAVVDVSHRTVHDDPTVLETDDSGAVPSRELGLVEADDQRLVRAGGAQQLEHLGRAGRVEAGDGFVGEDKLGALHEEPGDGDALTFATGEPFGAFVNGEPQPDPIEGGDDDGVGSRKHEGEQRSTRAPVAQAAGVLTLWSTRTWSTRSNRWHAADPPLYRPQLGRGQAAEVGAEHLNRPRERSQRAIEQPQQGALTRTARTQQGDPLAGTPPGSPLLQCR